MNRINKNMNQFIILVFLFILPACSSGLLIPAPAAGQNSVADEIISLEITDKPLGEVLETISDATGCQFSIDASWEDYPVTASFKNEPLYRVLKRIFRDLNNAVIYGSNRTIKIIIYDESTPAGKTAGYPVAIKPPEATVSQAQPYSDATAPQDEVPVAEDGSSVENVEQPSEEIREAVSETNQADTETAEASEEQSSEAAEKVSAPAQENNPSEEAESASDSSESSEKTENSEDTNQN
jgi:hypothetical protein